MRVQKSVDVVFVYIVKYLPIFGEECFGSGVIICSISSMGDSLIGSMSRFGRGRLCATFGGDLEKQTLCSMK